MSATEEKKAGPSGIKLLIDFGPLVLWLAANSFFGTYIGIAVFMLAILGALAASKILLKRVSPTLWLTAFLVIFFGSISLISHDPVWIQIKPTIIYLVLSAALFVSLWRGTNAIQIFLEQGFETLSDRGWFLLGRNWAIFFIFLAGFNEATRHFYPGQDAATGAELADNMKIWLNLKVYGVTALSLIFGAANIPMILRHSAETETEDTGPKA
ncbi:MAG: inner membrane-spanning protein YciB [Chakrabartia sp.]